MKILLLHDMSRVHIELKEGLKKTGVDVDVAILKNSKNNSTDINIGKASNSILSYSDRVFKQIKFLSKSKRYDIIQILSGSSFLTYPLNKIFESDFLKQNNTVYIAAGSDVIYRKYVRELKYYPPHDWYENDQLYNEHFSRLKNMKSIIPVCWEYKYAMERAGFQTEDIIHFPINLNKIKPKKGLSKKRKINIFHPLNRIDGNDFKGTKSIKKVFSQLEKEFGNKANFICKGNMYFEQYNNLNDQVDILVDQLYSYSYGMSAAYGLAKGQVVLSGMEKEMKQQPGFENCPVINANPSEEILYEQISGLIRHPDLIQNISENSFKYAKAHHSSQIVANKYIEIYQKILTKYLN